jgi:hypothetical protein
VSISFGKWTTNKRREKNATADYGGPESVALFSWLICLWSEVRNPGQHKVRFLKRALISEGAVWGADLARDNRKSRRRFSRHHSERPFRSAHLR